MEGTDTWNKLVLPGSSAKYTFFAPHNRAFMNVTAQQLAMFNNPQLSTDTANSIFSYHTGIASAFSVTAHSFYVFLFLCFLYVVCVLF